MGDSNVLLHNAPKTAVNLVHDLFKMSCHTALIFMGQFSTTRRFQIHSFQNKFASPFFMRLICVGTVSLWIHSLHFVLGLTCAAAVYACLSSCTCPQLHVS